MCLNAMTKPVYAFKLVMLGEYAVGKTSLVKRYLYDSFSPEYYPTLNVNISEKLLRFSKCDVRLVIWDVAGQEGFEGVRRSYFKNADVAVLVYDVSRPETLKSLDDWYASLEDVAGYVPAVVAGNKVDIEERLVDREEGEGYAKIKGFDYVETSAKTGLNVKELFTRALKSAILNKLRAVKVSRWKP